MATIRQVISLLSESLGVEVETVERTADSLVNAGFLDPVTDTQEAGPACAAKILTGLLATGFTMNAAVVVERLAHLPMRYGARTKAHGMSEARETFRVEDMPIDPGMGEVWNVITRSFLDALVAWIDFATQHQFSPGSRPLQISICRSTGAPMAIVTMELPVPDQTWTGAHVYSLAPHEDEKYVAHFSGLAVWAHAPGRVILQLGDLLAGRGDRFPADPAPLPADAA